MKPISLTSPRIPIGRLAGLVLLISLLTPDLTKAFTVELQRRDPESGKVRTYTEELDPKRVAVVAVDVWNFHWCKTSTERVSALVPRINKVLEQARDLGMTVFLCPTDVADNYAGTPMVERVIAVDPLPLPHLKDIQCPPAPDGGGCTCGGERCLLNFGWDGMHPELIIGPNDLMPNDPGRLYAICKERGITDLLYLGDLKPWRAVGMGHSPSFDRHRLSPGVQPPQVDKSNEGNPLRMHGVEYPRGIGVHAPNQLIYELKPAWNRFVARAGVDENVIAVAHGSNRGMHASVVFRVFIDGEMLAESPMMRLSSEPWRFDVPIPPGSKRISLCATDGGNGHYMDLANWVEAGFVGQGP